jgi:hypothetical protein
MTGSRLGQTSIIRLLCRLPWWGNFFVSFFRHKSSASNLQVPIGWTRLPPVPLQMTSAREPIVGVFFLSSVMLL